MKDPVMEQVIKDMLERVYRNVKLLERYIHEMDNTMNECDCGDRKVFDFRNVSTEPEHYILCTNCGGYIQVQDLEDCGTF